MYMKSEILGTLWLGSCALLLGQNASADHHSGHLPAGSGEPAAMEHASGGKIEHSAMEVKHDGGDGDLPFPMDAEYEPYSLKTMDVGPFGMLVFDQLEYRTQAGNDLFIWDVDGWYGGDFNRFWFRSEGAQILDGARAGDLEVHGYYSRLIAPFWDAQIGVRYDQEWEPGNRESRSFAAIGLEGFAPYRFEVVPAIFVSEHGDISARFTATRDYRMTQRWVLQPRVETEVSAREVSAFGVGSGFNYVEFGLRLRYEIRREVAPYIGLNWQRFLGVSENLVRANGSDYDVLSAVLGLRIWF